MKKVNSKKIQNTLLPLPGTVVFFNTDSWKANEFKTKYKYCGKITRVGRRRCRSIVLAF